MSRIHFDPEIGDAAADGAVLAGISPDTGTPFFAAAADEPAPMEYDDARRTANLKSLSGGRWRIASDGEHAVMRRNRDKGALCGTFNEAGWYWGSEINRRKARTWNIRDGSANDDFKFRPSAVRLVRD